MATEQLAKGVCVGYPRSLREIPLQQILLADVRHTSAMHVDEHIIPEGVAIKPGIDFPHLAEPIEMDPEHGTYAIVIHHA